MRDSLSEDGPVEDDFDSSFDNLDNEGLGIQKRRARKRLEDYFEQKRLQERLGDDEFGDID